MRRILLAGTNQDFLKKFANDNKEIVFSEMGQSNREGRDGDDLNPEYPFNSTIGAKWWNGSSLQTLNTLRGRAVIGCDANYFADKLHELTGYKMISIEAASGGAGMGSNSGSSTGNNWGDTGNLRVPAVTLTNQALAEIGTTIPIALWTQGERDAQEIDSSSGAYTKQDALDNINSILDWWFSNYPESIFVMTELGDRSNGANGQGWQDVREVQNQVASERDNVFIGFNRAKFFWEEGKMKDNLHPNYIGYKEQGEGLASFLSKL